jgi:hypothetical protein
MLYRTLREVVDYDGYYYAAKCLTSLARRFLPKNVSRAGSCEPVDYRVAELQHNVSDASSQTLAKKRLRRHDWVPDF